MNFRKHETIILVLILLIIVPPAAATVYFTTSAPGIITKGDSFSVSGTGAVNGTIAIWIVGRDHFDVLTTAPDRQGNFSLTIKPSATDMFSSGQYAVIYQDPGASGILEIEGGTDINGTLVVMNRGKNVVRLGRQQDLGGNVRLTVDQILNTTSIPGIDDTFLVKYFFVTEPRIYFDNLIPASGFRLPDRITDERIVISGTTNVGPENILSTEIRTLNTKEVVTTKNIPVTAGNPMNTWTWDLDAPGLPPGDYELTVGWPKSNSTSIGIFAVKNPAPPSPTLVKPLGEMIPQQIPLQNDYTFPVLVVCSLIVLAIVLFYAGRG